jgi:hypothetical protein
MMAKSAMNPLPSLIRASSWDAGDRSMRAAGRSVWSKSDYNAAAKTQNQLVRTCYGLPTDKGERIACVRFSIAQQMQEAGLFDLYSDFKQIFAQIEQIFASPIAAYPPPSGA